ncbi:MAG: hypothetical protein AABX07_05345, partial [Nanoarchaeota archaeon]
VLMNENFRIFEGKLYKPIRSSHEYCTNLEFLGNQIHQANFFGNNAVYEYVLRALEFASGNVPLLLLSVPDLLAIRTRAINGFSLLSLIRAEISHAHFSQHYDPYDEVVDSDRLLAGLEGLRVNGADLILTLASIGDVSLGDKRILKKMCLR